MIDHGLHRLKHKQRCSTSLRKFQLITKMRQIFQKLLGGLGATVPVQMMKGRDGSDVQDSCHLQTSIDFVTPKVLTQPYWRYFAGVRKILSYDSFRSDRQ